MNEFLEAINRLKSELKIELDQLAIYIAQEKNKKKLRYLNKIDKLYKKDRLLTNNLLRELSVQESRYNRKDLL